MAFTVRVSSVHPDIQDLPEGTTFAFQVLHDAWEEIYPRDFRTWQAEESWPRPGKSLPFLEDEVTPVDPINPWRYVLPLPHSEPFVRIQTPKFIASFDLLEETIYSFNGWSDDPEDAITLPSGLYRIQLTDEQWIVPLRAGITWGTTAYDMGNGGSREAVWALYDEETASSSSLEISPADILESPSSLLVVGESDFSSKVLLSSLPTLLYVRAPSSSYFSEEEYRQLGENYQGILRFAILREEEKKTSQRLGIGAYPAFLLFFRGRLIGCTTGWRGQDALQARINRILLEHRLLSGPI